MNDRPFHPDAKAPKHATPRKGTLLFQLCVFSAAWILVGELGEKIIYDNVGDIQGAGWEFGILLLPLGIGLYLSLLRLFPRVGRNTSATRGCVYAAISSISLYFPTLALFFYLFQGIRRIFHI